MVLKFNELAIEYYYFDKFLIWQTIYYSNTYTE